MTERPERPKKPTLELVSVPPKTEEEKDKAVALREAEEKARERRVIEWLKSR